MNAFTLCATVALPAESYLHHLVAPETLAAIGLIVVGALGIRVAKRTLDAIKEQTDANRKSADAALLNAEALINSERAWVMATLGWYEGGLHIANSASKVGGEEQKFSTSINLKLTCTNVGKSPAWISDISGRVDLVRAEDSSEINPTPPAASQLSFFGVIEALGPGETRSRVLQTRCEGYMGNDHLVSAFVLIRYRDIFGMERTTSLGYTIVSGNEMYRQTAFPERNRNT